MKNRGHEEVGYKGYVYDADTLTIIAVVSGRDYDAICRKVERTYDTDAYGLTFAPAFGMADGLRWPEDDGDVECVEA